MKPKESPFAWAVLRRLIVMLDIVKIRWEERCSDRGPSPYEIGADQSTLIARRPTRSLHCDLKRGDKGYRPDDSAHYCHARGNGDKVIELSAITVLGPKLITVGLLEWEMTDR